MRSELRLLARWWLEAFRWLEFSFSDAADRPLIRPGRGDYGIHLDRESLHNRGFVDSIVHGAECWVSSTCCGTFSSGLALLRCSATVTSRGSTASKCIPITFFGIAACWLDSGPIPTPKNRTGKVQILFQLDVGAWVKACTAPQSVESS